MSGLKDIYVEYIGKIKRSLHGRGVLKSLMMILNRYYLRFKYRKFDFLDQIESDKLDGPAEVKQHASKYEPSNHLFFKKLFENIDWPYLNSTFVDFGCGKGATLFYATKLGFKKIIGVEFSSELASIAAENMKKVSSVRHHQVVYEIINTDAALYEIPSDADCFYFFNPFDAVILDKVIQNINKSLEVSNRKILIVYLNALHKQVIDHYGFRQIKHIPTSELDIYYFGGACVYTNK
jgi:SAM-dependent methyltransferase